ncbi:MAG: helix-turn-helix transcriptional regulator [bacterium]|nr:helix-turn-helix transcriptional regulator [bacterium]
MNETTRTRATICCCPGDRTTTEEAQRFTTLCKVLGHEVRLGILGLLLGTDDALCVCEIEASFDLSQPTISHHLRLLREAGLVSTERRGTWIYYELAPEGAGLATEFATWLGRAAQRKGTNP